MDRIRFATAILDFSRRRGGAERYLVDLCSRMATENYEVHVYAERCDEEDRGIHFHRIKTFSFPKSLRLLSFAKRATREMTNGGYDITFGVGNTLKADILQPHGGVHWAWFWRSLRIYGNPILWVMKLLGRILSPRQWVSGYIEDAPYRDKDSLRVIAISQMVREDIIRWYGIPEDRIAVVYNGVDIERFHPRNRQYREEIRKRHGIEDEVVILFVSNNFRMKGLDFLMKALVSLRKEGHLLFKLLILGRDRKGRYLRLAKRLDISGEVVFAGMTDQIEKYYGAADLLVHPSFYDACSLTVLEALASGLPVITSASNGASGIITQGQEGFVLSDPRDSQILGQHISSFFDRKIRDRASEAARSLAESYSMERNWRKMEDIFQTNVLKSREAI